MRRALFSLVFLLGSSVLVGGCSSDSINGSGQGASSTIAGVLANNDLGDVLFGIYRQSIQDEPATPARAAKLAELDRNKAAFVKAINDVVNLRTVTSVAQIPDALFGLVDDGTLPALADHTASSLEALAQDGPALDALLDLTRQASQVEAIPLDELLQLLGRTLNDPEAEEVWKAVARIVAENDGVDAQGNRNSEPTLIPDLLDYARRGLQSAGSSTAGVGSSQILQALTGLGGALTEEASIRGTFNFGHPEWVTRIDRRGLPLVAQDPATGRLFAPFRDQDGDGLADVDGRGRFLDAHGQPIDRPTFGQQNAVGFDPHGRAVAGSGQPLFSYVDAKTTNLALLLQLSGELVTRDLHGKGRRALEAGLGPLVNGAYARDNPVLDAGWGALSLLKPEVTLRTLRAATGLIQRDPATLERLIVAMARGVRATTGSGASSGGSSSALVDDLLPLLDDLFDVANGPSATTPGVMATLAQLRTSAPGFAIKLAPLFRHVRVEREQTPDADQNTVDEARSQRVDRTRPAWIGTTDNRSAIHQLLDLLARADGCNIPLINKSLAVLIVETMADQSAGTIELLIPILTAMPGFLVNVACPNVSQDLASLDALARSGALDALLPLAKVFKQRNQVPLLLQLLARLQRSYGSLLRPLEEDLATVLESGAVEAFQEVLALSLQVRDPISNETLADSLADLLGLLVDDDATVLDPRGNRVPSRMHLLLRPLRELDRRVSAAGITGNVGQDLADVFLHTVTVNGREQLRNGSLVPLTARVLESLTSALPAAAADRGREVDRAATALRDAGSSRDVATLLALLGTIDRSPSRALLNRALVKLLTPHPQRAHDVFGGMVRLLVIGLQRPVNGAALQPLRGLLPYLARAAGNANSAVPRAVHAFQRLLTADQGKTILNISRAALNPARGETSSPAAILIRIVQKVEAAGGGVALNDRAALRSLIRTVVEFVRDDQSGLRWVFQLIRDRRV